MRYFQARSSTNYPRGVSLAVRCDKCARRYVHIQAHQVKCTKAKSQSIAPALRPFKEIEAKLESIAWRHGHSLEQLRAVGRQHDACRARRDCYAYLRSEHWSVFAVATYFNRGERSVAAQCASPEVRARQRAYLSDWWAKHKAEGQAA